ncbi:MAG: desulfoferrodoxin [Candidatus Omnitrophica bacterium]|nr:desulfoferrodoxin [Candidatus Omnitrophota bacterium]
MTAIRDIYKCSICGNVAEIVQEAGGALVCCNKPMEKFQAKTSDQGQEKHVPVIEETPNGIKIKVGSVEHPMEEKHYIKFIEIITANKVIRYELKPGNKPEIESCAKKKDLVEVREYCTLHNLWKA